MKGLIQKTCTKNKKMTDSSTKEKRRHRGHRGRFAGVALRLPVDQGCFGLCGASTSQPNPPCSGDFAALRSSVSGDCGGCQGGKNTKI